MLAFFKGSVRLLIAGAASLAPATALAQPATTGAPAAPPTPAPATASQPGQPAPAEAPAPQEPGNHPAPNSVFAEGLGAGILYSINYERMVIDDVAVRVGFGYVSVGASAGTSSASSSSSASYLWFPITASYTGIRTRHGAGLELGGGTTLIYTSASASALGTSTSGAGMTPTFVAMAGFRLHPVDHAGFNFRIGLMALGGEGLGLQSPDPSKFGFIPWGYISLGASF